MKQILTSLFFFIFLSISNAQKTKISGKVSNNKNEVLVGVNVILSGNKQLKTSTNIEGRYSFVVDANQKYTLTFSYVGYTTKTIDNVQVNKVGEEEVYDIILEENKKVTNEVIVTTTKQTNKAGETTNAVIAYQKNTNTVASVISAETIKRSPDKSTSDVLKRTPGTSLQEGKFIVVRGLADRYNQAMINGILLTSTEPDRKSFSFDLIPASVIDNIIINKAFVPELPGEWAGGLIQVNTKDIPTKNFFNLQLGTGFNTQTIGKDFYKDDKSNTDWLGIDNGKRVLPNSYTTKSNFDLLTPSQKTAIGKQLRNAWTAAKTAAPLNISLQMNGGFNTHLFNKKLGGTVGIIYNKSNRYLDLLNRQNTLTGNVFSIVSNFNDDRYNENINTGAFGALAIQLNNKNKISLKSILNIHSNSTITNRSGFDVTRSEDLKGTELSYKQNIFSSTQLNGEHSILNAVKLKWYGAFNILDGFVPDQRRILYSKITATNNPYQLVISNSLSQQSGSRIYQNLSDYIYTAGGDLSYTYTLFKTKQTLKGGYMLQIKDRLYDAQLFANYLPIDNPTLRLQSAETVFEQQNFGTGSDNKIAFDAIKGNTFRYLANTILNAGYIQFDNQFLNKWRIVWGARLEHYDQLSGSVKAKDPRHTYSKVLDILPGLNLTYKYNNKTNYRFSVSQTVIRPELREISALNLYDFELNASVQGYPQLQRTKITNVDVRYELYPKVGETFTVGFFYKSFIKPIEQIFSEGAGGSSTFTYRNAAKAITYGTEIEIRKKLDFITQLKNFAVQANASFINSRIKDEQYLIDRPLQGQSPYVINIGLLYDVPKHNFNATILFNKIGQRIYLVGDLSGGAGSPDIWEAPRPLLDLQLSKKIIKTKAELKLNVADILNRKQYFYQNANDNYRFQKNEDAYRFTRTFGTTFSFTINYSL